MYPFPTDPSSPMDLARRRLAVGRTNTLANTDLDLRDQAAENMTRAFAGPPGSSAGPTFATGYLGQMQRRNFLAAGGGKTDMYGNPVTADPSAPARRPSIVPTMPDSGGGGGGGESRMGGPSPTNGKQADGHWPIQSAGPTLPQPDPLDEFYRNQPGGANNPARPVPVQLSSPPISETTPGGDASSHDFTATDGEGYWHGGAPPPGQRRIVVGDKRPGSHIKGPVPEMMVPHNPAMRPRVVGKHGPQVIEPPKGGATIVPNAKNMAGLPHFAEGGDTSADNPITFDSDTATAKIDPSVDQQLMALSWGGKTATPGLTDFGGGNRAMTGPYGQGFATPTAPGPRPIPTMSDERGVVDVPRMMARSKGDQLSSPEQVFAANRTASGQNTQAGGYSNTPYQADPLAGTPWGTFSGNMPADAAAEHADFLRQYQDFIGRNPTGLPTDLERHIAARAQSFADAGTQAPTVPWTPQQPGPGAPAPGLGSWRQPLPTLSPGTDTSPVNEPYNPLGLTGPALQAWVQVHNPRTMVGRGAILNTELGIKQAGITQAREMALKGYENTNTLNRELSVHGVDNIARDKRVALRNTPVNIPRPEAGQVTLVNGKVVNSEKEPKPAKGTHYSGSVETGNFKIHDLPPGVKAPPGLMPFEPEGTADAVTAEPPGHTLADIKAVYDHPIVQRLLPFLNPVAAAAQLATGYNPGSTAAPKTADAKKPAWMNFANGQKPQ